MNSSRSSLSLLLSLMFFVSGFCSLVYQVVWIRQAFSHFGVIPPILSVVLSVFMLGLALGSWAGGRIIERCKRRLRVSAIALYGSSELFIGAGAFVVPLLYRWAAGWLLHLGAMDSLTYLTYSALLLSAVLVPWCFAMGTTFPFMMSFVRERDDTDSQSFSRLYVANVLGAAFGCLSTAGFLVEALGFTATSRLAGLLNCGVAALSFGLARQRLAASSGSASDRVMEAPAVEAGEIRLVPVILCVNGFASMAAEVTWTRSFTPVLGTTIYAFAVTLATYLLATFAGSSLYRAHLRRKKTVPWGSLFAGLSAASFVPIVFTDPRLRLGPVVVATIIPLCALLGYLTPRLIDDYAHGDARRAGRVYAYNVVGCVLGPLAAAYVLLPHMSIRVVLLLLSVPFLLLYVGQIRGRSSAWVLRTSLPILSLGAICQFATRGYDEPARLDSGAQVRRDHAATVVSSGTGMQKQLLVDGYGMTALVPVTKTMAHLPLMFFPVKPQSVLVICFGMGTTFRSALSWDISTTAVELIPGVREAFPFYHADGAALLHHPLGRIVIDDGRRYLKRTSGQFDVITIDPPPPLEAAGSSLLYSKDFYREARRHLRPSGIMAQWFPGGDATTYRAMARAVVESFPYVCVYKAADGVDGFHFLASLQPLSPPPVSEAVKRLVPAARTDLLEWSESKDLNDYVGRLLAKPISVQTLFPSDDPVVIDDDHPVNEYYLVRRLSNQTGTIR